ncbi:hypothetical protein [Actinomadura verrucosospora]|uniref:Uncharacterized protein n=1 Tax=Actinomadura verrucosospora TaxID=46165 RepID=A0A7D3VSQ3_ACTVE|nr:hypothetical protein [Actinomadura verrucosospora]QKG19116.1 hypothetical protein ACTIVE_0752 [Actinomadura verrucosospora]
MKSVVQLLTIVVASLIGGVLGSVTNLIIEDGSGALSTTDVLGFAVWGGVGGALAAISASALTGIVGSASRTFFTIAGVTLVAIGWPVCVFSDRSGLIIIGAGFLAGVLADIIARLADVKANAAGTAAATAQNPQFPGDSAQEK